MRFLMMGVVSVLLGLLGSHDSSYTTAKGAKPRKKQLGSVSHLESITAFKNQLSTSLILLRIGISK